MLKPMRAIVCVLTLLPATAGICRGQDQGAGEKIRIDLEVRERRDGA